VILKINPIKYLKNTKMGDSNFEFQVIEALRLSQNPTPANVERSEQLLTNTFFDMDIYAPTLLKIAADRNNPEFNIRQAAAITLDKNAKYAWNEFLQGFSPHEKTFNENSKNLLRQNLLNGVIECGHPKIISLLCNT
jgi:hypothetical protein